MRGGADGHEYYEVVPEIMAPIKSNKATRVTKAVMVDQYGTIQNLSDLQSDRAPEA